MLTNKRILWIGAFFLVVLGFMLQRWAAPTRAASLDAPFGIQGYLRQSAPLPLKAEIQNVQTLADSIEVVLCIEMPTLEPWNPYATLTIGEMVIPNLEVRLLNAKDPAIMKSTRRCYAFVFPFSAGSASSSNNKGVIKVETLWLELGNGQWNDQVISEIQRRLEAVAPGLDFEVIYVPGKNGGGMDIRLLSLPKGMSEEQALSLIQRLSIDELPVVWQSEISFK